MCAWWSFSDWLVDFQFVSVGFEHIRNWFCFSKLYLGEKARKVAVMSFAGSTLAKVSFLCTVLLEETETRHLAFRIGLYGMEMPRPPAVSKSLEVCFDILLLYSSSAILLNC